MGLQDRNYVKRKGDSRSNNARDSLKPDGDDMREHSVRTYKRTDTTPLWAHITVGIVVAAIVIFAAKEGWNRYQLYQVAQAMKAATEKMQAESAERHRQRIAQQQVQQRSRQYNSPQCVFWRNDYANKKTEKALEKVKEYCP
ncbi:hypothetical protein [Marinobacterium rhizophilum]|uniref:hypothetical protein n=1 Tax=Marinobacterium rhizophilum TaxID=420402 RepID=UPI0003708B68|nr:hypothetical protein [Marinobacterium rhizophilum]